MCARLSTFPCEKNVNFKLLLKYFLQFAVEVNSTRLHIFPKFGMANLFMDPVVHLIRY